VLEGSLAPAAIKLASATAQPGISFEIGAAAEAALRRPQTISINVPSLLMKKTYLVLEDYRYSSSVKGTESKDLSTSCLGTALIWTAQ
jgi:hypothetical protein